MFLEVCCFCISLRVGAIILGVLGALLCIAKLVAIAVILATAGWITSGLKIGFYCSGFGFLILLIGCILLIWGAIKKIKICVLIWLICVGGSLIIFFLLIIIIGCLFNPFVFFFLILIAIKVYFWMCVLSFYNSLG